ncbi:MAG: DEAD/DEAH box helicase [Thiolinea sp.]
MAETFDETSFLKLPQQTQFLLELMAVIYSEAAATPVARAAADCGIELPSGERLTFKSIKPELQLLVEQGWLSGGDGYGTVRYQCNPDWRDLLTQRSIGEGRFAAYSTAVGSHFNTDGYNNWRTPDDGLRDIRLAVLDGHSTKATQLVSAYLGAFYTQHPWMQLWGESFDVSWSTYIPHHTYMNTIAPVYLEIAFDELTNINTLWDKMPEFLTENPLSPVWDSYGSSLYWQFFARGQWNAKLLAQPEGVSVHAADWLGFHAVQCLYAGDQASGMKTYKKGLAMRRKFFKAQRGKKIWFRSQFEVLCVLMMLLSGDEKKITEGMKQAQDMEYIDPCYRILYRYGYAQKTGKQLADEDDGTQFDSPLALLLTLCTHFWLGNKVSEKLLQYTEINVELAKQAGYEWLVGEYSAALAELLPDSDSGKDAHSLMAVALRDKLGCQSFLIHLNRPQQEWERALEALQRLGEGKASAAKGKGASSEPNERLIWVIVKHVYNYRTTSVTEYEIAPRLQKRTKKGGWTAGRSVALKHLYGAPQDLAYLDEDDRRVCGCIEMGYEYNYSGYGTKVYDISEKRVWSLLVGHPRVFWLDALNTPLDIQQGKAELLTERKGKKIRIRLQPELKDHIDYRTDSSLVVEETAVQIRVYQLTASVLQLHEVLGEKGLVVPPEAEATLRKTLESLAPMITIQSDIQVGEGSSAETVKADPRIHIHMLPWGEGLRMMMRVQPFGEQGGPVFVPGSGRSNVLAEVGGKLLKTSRTIKQEQKQAHNIISLCPALMDWMDAEDDLMLELPEDCLEALEQLHALGDKVVLAWPEGEKMRVTAPVDAGSMSLKLASKGDWFHLDGKVQVDEETVLTLRQLLELSEAATGRFVALGDGQFLSLTRQFQKKLDALNAYAEKDGKKGVKIGALAGLALDDLVSDVGELKADKAWKDQLKRLNSIRDSQPEVPATLQAELRDYQLEGFRWMARLAEWGVGACLADDMGLGKTIQTLALLLTRMDKGAALVVAPTSVCNNWFSECQKFAPTLRPVFYRGKGREDLLSSVTGGDLLICSYGLLQQDAEKFQAVQWGSIVLDEAQAIKNTHAKRTKAAYQLQGDFRLITTGTPLENHLGELWSLFRFLNPGLLFSLQKFGERFQTPIERDSDPKARQNLKRLVQPFILRRTKNQVLQELPPRTEITLQISLGEGERALYEAMRQQALENLSKDREEDEEAGHLEVLAQITRLRLASCHPQLVMPESELPSAKLQALTELVEELLANQHKALIFSQFVKHLALIRDWLDQQGIAYHYLDGSTPQEARQKAVEAFQRGEKDIFLISLKAGGFGLNLTAADYVIHMDPWWNPAVEDQASDRAHRIGQQRPVTIYRLVAENTIEEKIVRLHQQKRDLADSLLEGSDVSGKLSAREMMAMIREG